MRGALLALAFFPAAVTASAGGSPYPASVYGLQPTDCQTISLRELVNKTTSYPNSCPFDTPEYDMCIRAMKAYCDAVCPSPRTKDFHLTCIAREHAYHGFHADFLHSLNKQPSLMWGIFFLIFSVAAGAFLSRIFPVWLPYTVGLLLIGIMLGAIAQRLNLHEDCPMHARSYDRNGDGRISRTEYAEFTGENFVPTSYCREGVSSFIDTQNTPGYVKQNTNVHTCASTVCGYSFEYLDGPYKISDMLAESVYTYLGAGSGSGSGSATSEAGSGSSSGSSGRRLTSSSSSGSSAAAATDTPPWGTDIDGDDYLTGDELWVPRCNLMRDALSLMDIDPHLMLVVFLPALLFESACFGIDMGIFRRQIAQILILAFAGMTTAALITGGLLYSLAPSTWSFMVCLLIGVIASATDPVAVVALLKELGAPKTLGTLIEGESLMNDGSAVVLFVWVRNCIGYDYNTLPPPWMTGESPQYVLELLRVVAQMLFFGIFLGFSFGFITVKLLKRLYNLRYVEVSLVVTMSYFVFWLGELVCGSSAVLAVVIMGLYVNDNKESVSPPVLHFLHEFYEMVAYFLNTVIFMIAGCKLGALMVDSSFHHLYALGSGSLWMIILTYPIILLARGAAMVIFFPFVSRLGTGCTWKDAVIMWWGGLRGSVGLALGLAVHHTSYDGSMWGDGPDHSTDTWGMRLWDPSINCRDQPAMVLIITLYVVVMTVVINGITMAPLMRMLKMTDVPEERVFMLRRAKVKLDEKTAKTIKEVKEAFGDTLTEVNWDELQGSALTHCVQVGEGGKKSCEIKNNEKDTWLLVMNMERAYYLRQFEDGRLGSKAFHLLEHAMADICAEAVTAPSSELGKIYDRIFYDQLIKEMYKMRPTHAFEAGLNYIACQHEVEHHIEDMKDGKDMKNVHEEHDDNLKKMQETLGVLRSKAPKSIADFQNRWVTLEILGGQRKFIQHLQHEGELLDLDTGPLIGEIDGEIEKVQKKSKKVNTLLKTIDVVQQEAAKTANSAVSIAASTAASAIDQIELATEPEPAKK